MSTYVVGDIQGCLSSLRCVLKKISFNTDKDVLWSVGDIVNRGPKSLKTLKYLYERRDNVVMVLGNHDLHLLAISAGVRKPNRKDTLNKILNSPDRDSMLNWLRRRPLIHNEHNHTMVHAGIPPGWSIDETKIFAGEVESTLQGPDADSFLRGMYGDYPNSWSSNLKGIERLRLITNYLTRMRYCTENGELDLMEKGPLKKSQKTIKKKKLDAWFAHENRKASKDKIVFGHWASINGQTNSSYAIGLDTGCVWGGKLSLYELESGQIISCDCSKIK